MMNVAAVRSAQKREKTASAQMSAIIMSVACAKPAPRHMSDESA